MPIRKNLRMVAVGNFSNNDKLIIIHEAEHRGCTYIIFAQTLRGLTWKKCHYFVCSESIFLKHKKFFEKAAERKIVVVITDGNHIKTKTKIYQCRIHEQFGCIGTAPQ